MLALMILSIAAHVGANAICPVWRSAPESANSLAVLGYLSQSIVVVVLLVRWAKARVGRFRLTEIRWLDRDGGGPARW